MTGFCRICEEVLGPKVGPGRPREYCLAHLPRISRNNRAYYQRNRATKLEATKRRYYELVEDRPPRRCRRCGLPATSRRHQLCDECREAIRMERGERVRDRSREQERPRASTTQRGYGTGHMRERARIKPMVERGEAVCAQCGHPIIPGSKWMLGHDHRNGGYAGPEHYKCGVAERNRRHARIRKIRSRVW